MTFDGIIFDIDGTLWNASASSAKGWNKSLQKLGIKITITDKQIESVAGKPHEECVESILPGLIKKYPQLLDSIAKYETETIEENGGVFYEGAPEGIVELSKKNKIFLISNCSDWYLKLFLELSGLSPYIAGYDCHGMSHTTKDQMLVKIKNNFLLSNPVYIGDTIWDEETSKKAGVNFLHVTYGFGRASDESTKFDSFDKLKKYLLENC